MNLDARISNIEYESQRGLVVSPHRRWPKTVKTALLSWHAGASLEIGKFRQESRGILSVFWVPALFW